MMGRFDCLIERMRIDRSATLSMQLQCRGRPVAYRPESLWHAVNILPMASYSVLVFAGLGQLRAQAAASGRRLGS